MRASYVMATGGAAVGVVTRDGVAGAVASLSGGGVASGATVAATA